MRINFTFKPSTFFYLCFFAGMAALFVYLSVETQPTVQAALLLFLLPLVLFFCLKYPEVSFALLLASGSYKTDQRLQQINSLLDLSLLLAAVTAVSILARLIKNREPLRLTKEASAPFLLLLIIAALSLTYTPLQIYGLNKLVKLFFITAPCFFFSAVVFNKKSSLALFFNIFLLITAFMLLDVLFAGISPGVRKAYSALGSNYLAFGRIAGFSVIIAIFYFFFNSSSQLSRIACFLYGSVMSLGMLVTGGRGPIIGLFMGIVSSLAAQKYRSFPMKKSTSNLAPLVIILAVSAFAVVFSYQEYFVNIFERGTALYRLEDASTVTRIDYYGTSLGIMASFPEFFRGTGLGGFGTYYNLEDSARVLYPHNIFLEIGSELGIFALAAFIAFIYFVFKSSLYNIRASGSNNSYSINMTLFVCLVYWLANAMFSGDINDNRFLFVVSGIICGIYEQNKNPENTGTLT